MTSRLRKHNDSQIRVTWLFAMMAGLACVAVALGETPGTAMPVIAAGTVLLTTARFAIGRKRTCPGCRRINAATTLSRERIEEARRGWLYTYRCKFCRNNWTRRAT